MGVEGAVKCLELRFDNFRDIRDVKVIVGSVVRGIPGVQDDKGLWIGNWLLWMLAPYLFKYSVSCTGC